MGDGLRERKRRRTRQEISDVATRLFFEHGFEAVTLARIADAAEVSVKTIFNHFGSKEDLYFDRAPDLMDTFARTIAERPTGVTPLRALRSLLIDYRVPLSDSGWESLSDPDRYAGFAAFLAVEDRSPALRARRLTLGEELGDRLAGALAPALGREAGDPTIELLTAHLIAILGLRDRVLRGLIARRTPAQEVRRRVVAAMEEAFDRLGAAFADVGA